MNLLKRVGNIIKDSNETNIDSALLKEDAEKALYDFSKNFEEKSKTELSNNNYEKYFKNILAGKEVINSFFDNVMVMDKDENIKKNRIALLKNLDNAFKVVADIKVID